MSTGFVVKNYGGVSGNNLDFSQIFQSGTSTGVTTRYKISNGNDIATLFAPYTSGTQASVTGYKVNGVDLNTIFAKKV